MPCKLFNPVVEDKTKVTLLPIETTLAAVAVPVAIVVDTDTLDMPVIFVEFICKAAEQVPAPAIILNSFTV